MDLRLSLLGLGLVLACGGELGAQRPIVGAIRWDGWHGSASQVGEVLEGTLGPKRYHHRLPFFAEVVSDTEVSIVGNTQEIVDEEIAYARGAGLDYWAFVTYPADYVMSEPLKLYLASERKSDIHFCLNLQGGWEGGGGLDAWPEKVERYVEYFRDPCYQTVLDGRPLVYLYSLADLIGDGRFKDWPEARQAFDQLRAATVEAGVPTPYVVAQDWTPQAATEAMERLGLDAIGAYALAGGGIEAPYIDLAAHVESWWDGAKEAGAPVVPLVMAGWDRRPRIERPHPWEPWQKPGEGMDRYYESPTPAELATHLGHALEWVASNSSIAEANAVLIYAWNENDEGGWIVPTLGDGAARLDAIAEVLPAAD